MLCHTDTTDERELKKLSLPYHLVNRVLEKLKKLLIHEYALIVLNVHGDSIMAQFNAAEVFNLLKCQVQLPHDHFKGDVKVGVPQNVVDLVHDEVFKFPNILFAVFFLKHFDMVALADSERLLHLVERLDHERLQVPQDLKPSFCALLVVEVASLADQAGLAKHLLERDDLLGHKHVPPLVPSAQVGSLITILLLTVAQIAGSVVLVEDF